MLTSEQSLNLLLSLISIKMTRCSLVAGIVKESLREDNFTQQSNVVQIIKIKIKKQRRILGVCKIIQKLVWERFQSHIINSVVEMKDEEDINDKIIKLV